MERPSTIPLTQCEAHQHGLAEAFAYCEKMAKDHYENFPVASLAIPRQLRPYVFAVYAFARTADDFADEDSLKPSERLEKLDAWERELNSCFAGAPTGPVFVALAETIARTGIRKQLLADLLRAFRLDVTKNRFATFDEVLDYCRYSANPVGRIVLLIFGITSARSLELSDCICTGLQLANFWQDVPVDLEKGRIYVPLEDLERFGYTERELQLHVIDDRLKRLMQLEVDRARNLLSAGSPLLKQTPPALRFELALTIQGGMRILEKIHNAGYDVFQPRPVISFSEKISILLKALPAWTPWVRSQPT